MKKNRKIYLSLISQIIVIGIVFISCDYDKSFPETSDSGVTPFTPTGVRAAAESPMTIRVSWNSVPGATRYNVYYSSSASGEFISTGGNHTSTSYRDDSLSALQTRFYRVSAVNRFGESTLSITVSATTWLYF
ncbi:MAG: fibronectin type III domain-containing protein [Treponema sp.]|jgi:fibronectin type 3 domain-containing protein|nr:fibronectin type III domain-containing protein [Treponema sp.]